MVDFMECMFVTLLPLTLAYGYMYPNLDCDFRQGICDWKSDDSSRRPWELGHLNGWSYIPKDNGPSGNYLFVKTGYEFQWNITQLRSVLLEQNVRGYLNIRYCLFSHKHKFDSLNIYIENAKISGPKKLVWSMTGNQGKKWMDGRICVYNDVRYTILIEVWNRHSKLGDNGTVALDDLKFNQAECEVKCNFEYGFCGWRQLDNSLNKYWRRKKHPGGYSLYLDGNSSANLESVDIVIDDVLCLTFWYDMDNADAGFIEVSVDENGRKIPLRTFHKSDDKTIGSTEAIVETEVTSRMMVRFILRGQTWKYAEIKLDNISITSGSCLDCTRYHAFCRWDGNSVWNINTPELFYATSSESSSRNESILTSKLETMPGKKCLSFPYLINSNCRTYIQVKSDEGMILSNKRINLSETNWTKNYIGVELTKKSRIAISFVHGIDCIGHYAIGSISFKKGLCQAPPDSTNETTSTDFKITTQNVSTKEYAICVSMSTKAHDEILSTVVTTTNNSTSTIATTSADSITNNATKSNSIHSTAVVNPTSVPSVTSSPTIDSTNGGTFTSIGIGCLIIIVAVLLVSVRYFRKRRISQTRAKAHMNGIVCNETNSGVSRKNNNNHNVRHASERGNQISEITTAQMMKPKQSKTPHIQVSGKVREPVQDTTYSHTMEFRNGTYNSILSCADKISDDTYDHTNIKINLENKYDQTNFKHDNTYGRTLQGSRDDLDPTYDHVLTDA